MITSFQKQEIINHSQQYKEVEVCGLICENGEVVHCENLSENPKEEFEISTEYFLEINAASRVKAIYHTHWHDDQEGWLSAADIANSKALKLPYVLYHTGFGEWDCYDPNQLYPYPLIRNPHSPKDLEFYLGWMFSYNRSDCYTLFRSYYKGMLDIELPDYPRGHIEETTSPNWDMFTISFEDCGFRKLKRDEQLQANDVILMNIVGDRTHHAATLLDPATGKALHNLGEGRLSEVFMYGGYWAERTRAVIRHCG